MSGPNAYSYKSATHVDPSRYRCDSIILLAATKCSVALLRFADLLS